MKLNYDCMRSVLIALENQLTLEDDCSYCDLHLLDFLPNDSLCKYDKNDIAYSIYKLAEADYLIAGQLYAKAANSGYWIRTITFQGHEFLENIRKDETWGKVKSIAEKIGTFSLNAIEKISEGVTAGLIGSYFSNPH